MTHLSCMDNGIKLRRGMPTAWVKFGYDMAVLAGDALLIYAVETAAKAFSMTEHGERVGRAIGLLAEINRHLRNDWRSGCRCGADRQAHSGRKSWILFTV